MSPEIAQILLIVTAAILLALLVAALARRGLLSLRYTLGWMFVATIGAIFGIASGLVRPVSDAFNMTETGLLLALTAATLVLITIQLSITASGLQEAIRTLAESHALLEERVRRAERGGAPTLAVGVGGTNELGGRSRGAAGPEGEQ
jgi:hypothetical protein